MKEHLDEPLLYDEENTIYADWNDSQTPLPFWRKRVTLVAFLIKLFAHLLLAAFIFVFLAFACPQFLLSCLQNIPGSQIEYAYRHCESFLPPKKPI